MKKLWATLLLGLNLVTVTAIADIPEIERNALLAIAAFGNSETLKQEWSGMPGTECDWPKVACDANRNHIIQISIQKLSLGQLHQSIGQFQQLIELNLTGNRLTTLPQGIGELSNLNQLVLAGNYLKTLPEAIGQLDNLRILRANQNNLTKLPNEIGKLKQLIELRLY